MIVTRFSKAGRDLLKSVEGFRKKSYKDSGGAPTIGVGHLLTKAERSSGKIRIDDKWVRYADGLTDAQVEALMTFDLDPATAIVQSCVTVPLNQNQFDALVCFVFNVGSQAFVASTLRALLNAGKYSQVPAQLRRWVHDNGRKVRGLANRREAEIKLWETPA